VHRCGRHSDNDLNCADISIIRRLPVFGGSTGPSRRLQWAIASATTTAFDGQRRYIAALPTPARDAISSMFKRS
jgi:hypothetical protein